MSVRHGFASVSVSEAGEKWLWLGISQNRAILSQKFAQHWESLVPYCEDASLPPTLTKFGRQTRKFPVKTLKITKRTVIFKNRYIFMGTRRNLSTKSFHSVTKMVPIHPVVFPARKKGYFVYIARPHLSHLWRSGCVNEPCQL